jgi:hypothetical protein
MGEIRNAYKVLENLESLKVKAHLEDPHVDGRIII